MNEELRQKLEKLERENQELLTWKKNMEASHSIPLNIDQAFRARFPTTSLSTSTKVDSSENQAVDEGGAATYSVLKPPDAFLQVRIRTTTYYIPVFT